MKESQVLAALIAGLAVVVASAPVRADSVLYNNNTAESLYIGDFQLNNSSSPVTDSFTLSGASTLTGVYFDVWVNNGDSLSSVEWSIGATPYSGTPAVAEPTNEGQASIYFSQTAYLEEITLPNLSLGAGTYYFTLQDATTANSSYAYWDISEGPSTAYYGPVAPADIVSSESFQILGTTDTTTPEPSSFVLLGSGLAMLAGVARRRLRA